MEFLAHYSTVLQIGIMEFLHLLFSKPWVPVDLALAMIFMAVVMIAWAWFEEFNPLLNAIEQKQGYLEGIKDYEDFNAQYNDVKKSFDACVFLKHGWSEFTETLIVPEGNKPKVIKNTERPHSYLTIDCLEKTGVHLSFWKALPNYFVGFGLLFTFIGLVVAIDAAAQGVASGNVEETQAALGRLLSAATFKFFTSIAGILCSLMSSIALKRFLHKVEKGFISLSDEVEEKLLWVAPQSIAVHQLDELKKQSSELQHFNQEFGMQLSERLAQVLENTFEPLTESMKKMSGNVDSIQMDSINSALKNVNTTISGAANDEMKAMVQAMEGVRHSLETTTVDLKSHMAEVGESFGEKMGGAAESLDPFTSQMARFNDNIEQFSTHMDNQKDAMSGVVEKINEAADSIDAAAKGMRSAGDPVLKTADKMSKAADKVESAMGAMQGLQTSLSSMATTFGQSSEAMKSAWEDYQSRFSDVDESLKNTVEHLIEGNSAHQKNVQDFVGGLDRSLKEAMTSLSSGIDSLNDTMEDLTQVKE